MKPKLPLLFAPGCELALNADALPDPVLTAFDSPNADFSCARRTRSNTPLAALTSLNETIFVEAAQALAQRILHEGGIMMPGIFILIPTKLPPSAHSGNEFRDSL